MQKIITTHHASKCIENARVHVKNMCTPVPTISNIAKKQRNSSNPDILKSPPRLRTVKFPSSRL